MSAQLDLEALVAPAQPGCWATAADTLRASADK